MIDDKLRYVYTTKVRCPWPSCRSADVKTYRTNPFERDGTRSRYTLCRACGHRFLVVIEDPGFQSAENPPTPQGELPHAEA